MGLTDLKIEQIRPSNHWTQRHWRMNQLKTTTAINDFSPKIMLNPTTSVNVPINNGINYHHNMVMNLDLWEAAKNGDVDNFINCLEKFLKEKKTSLSTIFSQLTVPDQDTFLHVVARFGHEELTGLIAHHFRELITSKNQKGDSALHLAARAGHLGVVDIIVRFRNRRLAIDSFWDEDDDEQVALFRRRVEDRVAVNDEGNTALHEALIYHHNDVAEYLMEWNEEAAYHVNKKGKSPLYMAVEAGNVEYVKKILRGKSEYMHTLDEQLTKGKSLLHAAIMGRNIAILKEITVRKPLLIDVKDEDGLSALDFASSTGFLEGVNFLQNKSNMKPDQRIENIRQSKHWKRRHRRLKTILDANEIEKSPEGFQHGVNQNSMDLALYIAAKKGNIDEFINALYFNDAPVSVICNQRTPLQNTFLHVAASYGNEDFTGFMVHHFRNLLGKRNHRDDTALHAAARSGHVGVVGILLRFRIDQMKKDDLLDVDIEKNNGTLIGKFEESVVVNADGNTALHEALMNNHLKVAEYLIKENVEDAYHVNKQGKSALYMAIETKTIDCVKLILNSTLSYTGQHILDEEVSKGKSLLHAAITARSIVLLQEIAKLKPALIHIKENGQTPLLYSASINFFEGVQFLLNQCKMDIFERDADGFYPIHCASKNGHVGILEELLKYCPDAREFLNRGGQDILHVAAIYGKDAVVKYILKTPGLELLLNGKDRDGNTALHLATINWHPKIVSSLTWDKRVDLKPVNDEGLTAIEVAEKNMEAMTSYRERLTWMALMSAGAGRAKVGKKSKLDRLKSAINEPFNTGYCKDRVDTLLLVSTLIATVTFAAGFTMPGGYNNSEPDTGMSVMLNKLTFQLFVVCDTIALYSAIMVAVSLIWAQLGDLTLVLNALRVAIPLLGISLTMMLLAFMASVYLVVSKLVWLANVVLIMGVFSLATLMALFIPFNLPYSSTVPISRYISYYPFCLLMLASGSYYDPDVEQETDSF